MEPHERDRLMIMIGEMRGDIKALLHFNAKHDTGYEELEGRVTALESRNWYEKGAVAIIAALVSLAVGLTLALI